VKGLWTGRSVVRIPAGIKEFYLFSETSWPPIKWISADLSFVVKWQGRETDSLLPCSTKIMNEWSYATTTNMFSCGEQGRL
jgi:hypothetical protein